MSREPNGSSTARWDPGAATFGTTISVRADGLRGKQAEQYKAQVLGMLHALDSATQTGKAILNAIRQTKRNLLIFPYDGRLGQCNAATFDDWGI